MLTGTAVTVDIWAKVLSSADRDVFNLVNVTSDEHHEGNISNTTVHVRIVDLAVDKLVNNSVPKDVYKRQVYASSNIVLMLTNEPELEITKYVNDTKILENIENADVYKRQCLLHLPMQAITRMIQIWFPMHCG